MTLFEITKKKDPQYFTEMTEHVQQGAQKLAALVL